MFSSVSLGYRLSCGDAPGVIVNSSTVRQVFNGSNNQSIMNARKHARAKATTTEKMERATSSGEVKAIWNINITRQIFTWRIFAYSDERVGPNQLNTASLVSTVCTYFGLSLRAEHVWDKGRTLCCGRGRVHSLAKLWEHTKHGHIRVHLIVNLTLGS